MIGYLFVDYSSIYDMNMDREKIDLTDVSALSDVATTDPQSITVCVNRRRRNYIARTKFILLILFTSRS